MKKYSSLIKRLKNKHAPVSLISDVIHNDAVDDVYEHIPDRKVQICAYLIHNISPYTNIFKFSITRLANKFNCSKQTVKGAIKVLNHCDVVKVTNRYIKYKNYHPYVNRKGGNND